MFNAHLVQSGKPQGGVLAPYLYLLQTTDVHLAKNTTFDTFSDNTVIDPNAVSGK